MCSSQAFTLEKYFSLFLSSLSSPESKNDFWETFREGNITMDLSMAGKLGTIHAVFNATEMCKN